MICEEQHSQSNADPVRSLQGGPLVLYARFQRRFLIKTVNELVSFFSKWNAFCVAHNEVKNERKKYSSLPGGVTSALVFLLLKYIRPVHDVQDVSKTLMMFINL